MMKFLRVSASGVLLLTFSACSKKSFPIISTKTNTPTAVYTEDLSVYRPKFNATKKEPIVERKPEIPKYSTADQPLHVNRRLDMVLDTISMRNRSVKHAQGFRIQVYVGNNRQEADAVKTYIYTTLPEILPYVTFTNPTYRIKVGDFLTRLDAERYFEQLKTIYPSAMILPEKVEIKKGIMVK